MGRPAPDGGALVLASRSPQRAAILTQLGIPFVTRPTGVAEAAEGDPGAVALGNARAKALAAPAETGEMVLGVDTLVTLGGEIYGKPADAAGARATLARLQGTTHQVISGLVVRRGEERREVVAVTQVRFRALTEAQIAAYVGLGEWPGRAGGYAIQERGAALVEAVEGDYLNVVGLPVAALLALAPELGPLGRARPV